MRTMLLKIFFLIPSWFFNIFVKKRHPYRGHIFDQQSQALISLQPSIDLSTIPDNEISDIRNLITENRIKNKLSLSTKNPVMKLDHFVDNDTNILLRPSNLDEMINLGRKIVLKEDFKFARVDFYEVQGVIYFGEITFFPGGGIELFENKKMDKIMFNLVCK